VATEGPLPVRPAKNLSTRSIGVLGQVEFSSTLRDDLGTVGFAVSGGKGAVRAASSSAPG